MGQMEQIDHSELLRQCIQSIGSIALLRSSYLSGNVALLAQDLVVDS